MWLVYVKKMKVPITQLNPPYLPKDFVETSEGLCFALVQGGVEVNDEQQKVLCFLRYIRQNNRSQPWHKVSTAAANSYLQDNFPEYLHYSKVLDVNLHGVELSRIIHHYRPQVCLQEILSKLNHDRVEQDFVDLCRLFQHRGLDLSSVGVTGSFLIGAQRSSSDIDLVIYNRDAFHQARGITAALIEIQHLSPLTEQDWQEAYERRMCDLRFEDYVWHEQRKFNKALVNGRKFDLNLVQEPDMNSGTHYQKLAKLTIQSTITDDYYSFDYPALYGIDEPGISTVACFIATYTGQAKIGERVEIAGLLEQAEDGSKRIVVGSSREAPGEYIKVLK